MDEKQKESAQIIKWPKEAKPIPPDSMPGAHLVSAVVAVTKEAHEKELRLQRRKLIRSHARKQQDMYQQVCEAIRGLSSLNEIALRLLDSDSKKPR